MDSFQNGFLDCDFANESLCNWSFDKVRSIFNTYGFKRYGFYYSLGFSIPKPDRQYTIDQIVNRNSKDSGEILNMFESLARAEEIYQKSGSYIYIIKDNKLPYNKAILSSPRIQSSRKTTAYLKLAKLFLIWENMHMRITDKQYYNIFRRNLKKKQNDINFKMK